MREVRPVGRKDVSFFILEKRPLSFVFIHFPLSYLRKFFIQIFKAMGLHTAGDEDGNRTGDKQ